MGNIKYILSRLSKMDYKAMLNKVNEVHKKTGKSRLAIFLDMSECAKEYWSSVIWITIYLKCIT